MPNFCVLNQNLPQITYNQPVSTKSVKSFQIWTILLEFLSFFIQKNIQGKPKCGNTLLIFADAPFRETLSDFHSVKSADFALKSSFKKYPLQKMTQKSSGPPYTLLPISILLKVAFILSSIEYSFIVFRFVYIRSHIFSHI